MEISDNLFDFSKARDKKLNVKGNQVSYIETMEDFYRYIDTLPSPKRVGKIEDFIEEFAIIPVNTLLWRRFDNKKYDNLYSDFTDDNGNRIPGNVTLSRTKFYSRYGIRDGTYFELLLIKLAFPTTLQYLTDDIKYEYKMSAIPQKIYWAERGDFKSIFGQNEVLFEMAEPQNSRLGINRAVELNIRRCHLTKMEMIKEVFALIDEQTAIRAIYCLDIRNNEHPEVFNSDVDRMLKNIITKVKLEQVISPDAFKTENNKFTLVGMKAEEELFNGLSSTVEEQEIGQEAIQKVNYFSSLVHKLLKFCFPR